MSEQELHREHVSGETGAMLDDVSLAGLDAMHTQDEALQRAGRDQAHSALAAAHGRAEEEARLLSERMTHEAQGRRKSVALAMTAPIIPPQPTWPLPAPYPIHRTLVAVDVTPYSARALPYAAALARLTGCAVTLGACAPRAEAAIAIAAVSGGSAPESSDRVDRVEHALRDALIAAHDKLASVGLDAPANMVHAQDIADGLLALEQAADAEVLALATHARQGLGRVVLGSVADDAVRHGHGLTLIIPPLTPEGSVGEAKFERILVPLDGSELSEQALRVVQPLLQGKRVDDVGGGLSAMTLLYVATDRALVSDGEDYLRDVRESLLSKAMAPVEITTHVAIGSSPGAIVAWAAGEQPATSYAGRHDLIVMATHGRGGASRWLYGSVAAYVLSHSEVPVLLVRS